MLIGLAVLAVSFSAFASYFTGKWHWFGRSGAIATMSGILLSTRLLPPTEN
jgi:hypothetical protein